MSGGAAGVALGLVHLSAAGALLVAAAPLVGYGSSAILGECLSAAVLA